MPALRNFAYGHDEDDDCEGGSGCAVSWDCISCMQVNTSCWQKMLHKLRTSSITLNLPTVNQFINSPGWYLC